MQEEREDAINLGSCSTAYCQRLVELFQHHPDFYQDELIWTSENNEERSQ